MSQSQAPALSEGLELPAFVDRLPDLVQVLRDAGSSLQKAHEKQSYLPYWEDTYAVAHSLKGVLKILNCPPPLAEFITKFCDLLTEAIAGNKICRNLSGAGNLFARLSHLLDFTDFAAADKPALDAALSALSALYQEDVDHQSRLEEVPAHLVYVSETVSKKAREISLLGLNQCVIEDQILLDEIPLWRTQLNEALLSEEFGRGLVVNFLPFISSEGSRKLNVWAWIAAPTSTRAALKARIKEVMPKVQLGKL